MTVSKLGSKKAKCPYCGLVPADDHPDYTCPRIRGASWDNEGGGVEFIDPEKWEVIKDHMRRAASVDT